jgi:hypothetical protein
MKAAPVVVNVRRGLFDAALTARARKISGKKLVR